MKTISIGRAPDNDLVLNENKVSRYHARIYYRSGSWHIVDLQSTHGTAINDNKVEEPVKIRPSDKIKLSETKIIFDGKNLLSSEGKVICQVVRTYSSSKNIPINKKSSNGRVKVLAFAGLASTFLLLGAVFLLFNTFSVNPTPDIQLERESNQVTQQGTIRLSNGRYSGELLNGMPHGFGTIEYFPAFREDYTADSLPHLRTIGVKSYKGYWSYGLKHGHGKKEYLDGSVVEGYWDRGEHIGP